MAPSLCLSLFVTFPFLVLEMEILACSDRMEMTGGFQNVCNNQMKKWVLTKDRKTRITKKSTKSGKKFFNLLKKKGAS